MSSSTDVKEALLKYDRRFSIQTYLFVNEALNYAQERFSQDSESDQEPLFPWRSEELDSNLGHVTGQDLCYAVLEYAVAQYGYLAKVVLARLGIRKTGDLGDAVFNLLKFNLMQKSDSDKREDFDDVFDLGRELDERFHFDYRRKRDAK